MSYRYPTRRVTDGDVVDPQDVAENLKEAAGEVNGHIDRDNLSGTVTHDKLALDALVALDYWDRDGDGSEGVHNIPITAGQNASEWVLINDLKDLEFESVGGVHTFRGRLEWEADSPTGTTVDLLLAQVGLFVDGELRDQTDGSGLAQSTTPGTWDCGFAFDALPLEPGTHTVSLAMRFLMPNEAHDHDANIDVQDGAILHKEYRA